MVRNIQMDMKRAIFSYKVIFALFGIMLLWIINGKRFSQPEDLFYLFVYTKGLTITTLLAIIISNVGYGTSFCEDFKHYAIRPIVIRTSVKKYVISKIIVCSIVTMLIYVVGTLLFVLIMMKDLPLTTSSSMMVDNIKSASCFDFLLPEHSFLVILIQCILDGMCCCTMSVVALSLSTFIPNEFIVLCIPLVIYYLQIFLFIDTLKLPAIFDFEQVFMACFTDNISIGHFILRALLVFLFYHIVFGVLMYWKVKRRVANE
ncbi:hypothetical protein [Anaerosacchariphilus polymeriproducens]|uniref:Uncharacterized protein n=1 Tax=Anaerosacchariphilus polymeriproducens TaxID=1812858 RepID=A0A371AYF2_9FIRM|nr:hypothetical protein [Anaerosacchariphilus polymeriproducens]RDU24510.1 hypothetical protein DWV06_03335 [Anaerosacchariphilus polymeriproducens]